jgi:hypothetical protein
MTTIGRLGFGMWGLITIAVAGCDMVGSGVARQDITATDRKLVILLDATGSMSILRPGDTVLPNRFKAAQSLSQDDLVALAGDAVSVSGVRLFQFHNLAMNEEFPPALDPVTEQPSDPDGDGWFTPGSIQKKIAGLPGPTGLTPMAGSMCDAADVFAALPPDTVRLLATYSDGGENNTNPMHACFSADTNTWHAKVTTHMLNAGVQFNGVLFTNVSLAPSSGPDPETGAARRSPDLAAESDADLFAHLAEVTGGTFRSIGDSQPVPVFADVTGDSAVDRTDAVLLARQFGQAADPAFDLNADGVIDFNDYLIVISRLGVGGGQPDPFTPTGPVVCDGSHDLVIDGRAVEDAALTVTTHGACKITIRNSLIVSGHDAITILGSATVVVDNSVIVGQDLLFTSRGAIKLSAANSVFHGKTDVRGQLKLTDRGGNVFE